MILEPKVTDADDWQRAFAWLPQTIAPDMRRVWWDWYEWRRLPSQTQPTDLFPRPSRTEYRLPGAAETYIEVGPQPVPGL